MNKTERTLKALRGKNEMDGIENRLRGCLVIASFWIAFQAIIFVVYTFIVMPNLEKEAFLEGFHAWSVSTHLMLIEKYDFTNPTAVDDCLMLLGKEKINKTWFESYKNREK